MSETFRGGCHCGSIRYEVVGEPGFSAHCGCSNCRRISGTGHKSIMMLPEDGMKLTGTVSAYQYSGGSGATVTHHFCPDCGSGLYSRISSMENRFFLYPSSLDDPEQFKPSMVIYTGSAPSWDFHDPALPAFEETPKRD